MLQQRIEAMLMKESSMSTKTHFKTHSAGFSVSTNVDVPEALKHLKQVILLAGAVHPTPLQTQLGRSVLDLPIDENRSILNHWQDHIAALAQKLNNPQLSTRIMIDWAATAPISAQPQTSGPLEINRDPLELRGTGGVLHDLSQTMADEDYLLVISAKQLLTEPLDRLVRDMAKQPGDVHIVSYEDGMPSGVLLCRCGVLREIAPIGFVDMKEQALPQIARHHTTCVLHRPAGYSFPIRHLEDYLRGLRALHHVPGQNDEAHESRFTLVETGAQVDSSAYLHDAVILRGAQVGAEAVVARSLVAPRAIVHAQQTVVDQLVTVSKKT